MEDSLCDLIKSLVASWGCSTSPRSDALLSWLRPYLKVAAILESRPLSALSWLLIFLNSAFLALSCTAGWVLFYYRFDDVEVNTEVILHASIGAHTLYAYAVYLRHSDRMRAVSDAMVLRFRSFDVPGAELWDRADRLSLLIIKLLAVDCYLLFTLFTLYAILLAPTRQMIFPVWIPFSLEGNASYLLVLAHQVCVFIIYLAVHLSGCGLSVGGAHFLGASFDVLGKAFHEACRSSQQDRRRRLRSCVRMHVAILNVVGDYKAVYDGIIVELLSFCAALISFIGFQVVLAFESKDYVRMIIYVIMVIASIFHMFMFCYPGQHITNKNEQFRLAVYDSAWENLDLPLQRFVLMTLRRSLIPVCVSYRGVIHASMESFLSTLRTAFSYVNILLFLRDVH